MCQGGVLICCLPKTAWPPTSVANDGVLTIEKAPITITVNNASKVYGNADPTLTWTITNGKLVGNDTLDVVLTRQAGETVGTYTISASVESDLYDVTVANDGVLTVTQREVILTWGTTEFIYNGKVQAPVVTVSGLVYNDVCTVTWSLSGNSVNVGQYTATVTALSNSNYKLPANTSCSYTIQEKPQQSTNTGSGTNTSTNTNQPKSWTELASDFKKHLPNCLWVKLAQSIASNITIDYNP